MLDHLPPEARVLDLGCRDGSFPADQYKFQTVRVDMVRPKAGLGGFVQADSARLPFQSASFDLVVLNHVLEHFSELPSALDEIGRVVKKTGSVFVAVPDASTFGDRLYRLLYKDSGGHVNRFESPAELAETFSAKFGLPHVGTRTLFTSLVYLNRNNTREPGVRGQMRVGGLWQPLVVSINAACRLFDRWFGTRSSVYGWALYFGWIGEPLDLQPFENVCVRCGEAHPAPMIEQWKRVRRRFPVPLYECPGCHTLNVFVHDRPAARLR